ncbi:MAG: hypothetical protein D6725_09900 [Planctomycetota bacterium]|nr:MAG: hypothetical protein D6725_09900 [Planctomycetota bacterium]
MNTVLRALLPITMLWFAAAFDLAADSGSLRLPAALPAVAMAWAVSRAAPAGIAWAAVGGLLVDCCARWSVGPGMVVAATAALVLHLAVPRLERRSLVLRMLVVSAAWIGWWYAGLATMGRVEPLRLDSVRFPSPAEAIIGLACGIVSLAVAEWLCHRERVLLVEHSGG